MYIKIIICAFFTYGLLTSVAHLVSDHILFQPPTASLHNGQIEQEVLKIKTKEGKKISAIYLPNPKATYTLLISQGNDTNLDLIMSGLEIFQQQGYSIFAYDYQGYGFSEGTASERNTYSDIEAAYNYLIQVLNISPSKIIIHGRSLGTGPSVDLASRKPSAGIIIESGFLSAFRVYTGIPLFPLDKYTNYLKIKKIKVPVLIVHGTADQVIPLWHAKKLYQLANHPKKYHFVDGGLHNFHAHMSEIEKNKYFNTINEFIHSIKIDIGGKVPI